MYSLPIDRKVTILKAFVEGCSIRSIERMTGHHRDTIMRLLVGAGEQGKLVMDTLIKDVETKYLEVDELWCYVQKKDKHLKPDDPAEFGSHYIFVAIDTQTKLVPCFSIGQRDLPSATSFMWRLKDRITGRPQLTTDGLLAYRKAVQLAFGKNVDFAQLIKLYQTTNNPKCEGYSPVEFVLTKQAILQGCPEQRRISTSYIE